jgi:preprotein translocase subunit SecD
MMRRVPVSFLTAVTFVTLASCVAVMFAAPLGAVPHASMVAASASTLEVRLAETAPGPGLSEATVAGSGEKIYLHPEAVITNADVTSAHVIPGDRPGTFNVGIMFSADGSAKMQKATQAHLNKPLAILVNGHLVSAPTLRSQIRGSAVVTGDFTNAEASALAASLNGQ